MEICDLEPITCCGILELHGVESCKTAREAVVDAAEGYFEEVDLTRAYILYTTTGDSRIGLAITQYISKYRLGVVQKTRPTLNNNTGNMVTAWMWSVNKRNFESYWHKTNRYIKNYKNN
jgi:hypothetical protein